MNAPLDIVRRPSVCPHDCPSVCALDVEVIAGSRIGRVHGARDQRYTAGVVCAKVARYSERIHHPDRLTRPLRRVGPKGSGQFVAVGWDEALDIVADKFLTAERAYGAESVWPYWYAGTMGLVMRDGLERLTHVKRYSRYHSTICTGISFPGYIAGTGRMSGVSSLEIAKSDCVVIWGTNAVATQVNLMTHAIRARKERGAKIVAIDIYDNETMRQADLALRLKPGTDGALACAVMHVLFRDGWADRDYMARHTDDPQGLEAHVRPRDPCWASAITGLAVEDIEAFAALVGRNKRTFFRLGFGFTRQRNGASNMHAAVCIPAVTGAWAHEGGGALHSNSGIYKLDKTLIEGLDARDTSVRRLDQSRIGAILTGEAEALKGGGPVKAMVIQNTNPMVVAPDQAKVRRGFCREDLFTCVHEQFLTDTARHADIVLPATMFLEHDDLYTGGGHQFLQFGGKAIEPPEGCRSNHEVICALAKRLGAEHPGFQMSAREIVELDVARFRPRDAGRTRGRALARLPAAVRGRAFPERLRACGPQVSFPRRLASSASCQRRPARRLAGHARSAGSLGGQRGGRRGASVQADDFARTQFPQFELQSDGDLGGPRGPAVRADAPRRRRGAGVGGGRRRAPREYARLDAAARSAVRGMQARRDRQRGPVGQCRLPRRTRHQHADRRRQRRPVRRRGVSRRAGLGEEGTLPKEENAEIEVAKKAEAVVFG